MTVRFWKDFEVIESRFTISGIKLRTCKGLLIWSFIRRRSRKDNVERIAAEQLGISLWRRAQLLGDILSWKKSIVVTGCHGKTTTSGLVAWMLAKMDLDPLALIGGEIRALGGNALNGHGEWSVAEGDESDKSFLYLHPDIAVSHQY